MHLTRSTHFTVQTPGRIVNFTRDPSIFNELDVTGMGGIFVEEDLTTVDGPLTLRFDLGDLELSPTVDILAIGNHKFLLCHTANNLAKNVISLNTFFQAQQKLSKGIHQNTMKGGVGFYWKKGTFYPPPCDPFFFRQNLFFRIF